MKIDISYKTFMEYSKDGLNQKGEEKEKKLQQFMGFAINQYRLQKHFEAYLKIITKSFYFMNRVGNIRGAPVYQYSYVSRYNQEALPYLSLY